MTASGDDPRDSRSPRNARWLRDVTDRVPTAWLPGIVTAVFLGAAAAFGGLEAVAAPPIATLQAGEEHRNDMLAFTVERAVLIDSFPEAGASANAEKGERVLAVVVTAENTWDRAVPAENDASLTGMLRAPSLADPVPVAAARFDDGTKEPWLQPGLPAELVVTWIIDEDELAAGDQIELDLRDFSLQQGQVVFSGDVWSDPVVTARIAIPSTDVGAGADAEQTEGEQ